MSQPPSPRPGTIIQGGRAKAFRPLARGAIAVAVTAGVAAYERGDFFEAHELLEPAWMGTDDLAERELYQGLIKLAAAHVHLVRGNRAGAAKNLTGALARLADARKAGRDGESIGLDVAAIEAAIAIRLAELASERPLAEIAPVALARTPEPPEGAAG